MEDGRPFIILLTGSITQAFVFAFPSGFCINTLWCWWLYCCRTWQYSKITCGCNLSAHSTFMYACMCVCACASSFYHIVMSSSQSLSHKRHSFENPGPQSSVSTGQHVCPSFSAVCNSSFGEWRRPLQRGESRSAFGRVTETDRRSATQTQGRWEDFVASSQPARKRCWRHRKPFIRESKCRTRGVFLDKTI